MIGMNRLGLSVSGKDYIIQLIEIALNIKKGTLVMRRNFGGSFIDLVDSRNNFENAIKYSMIASCIMACVPQFKVSTISVSSENESNQSFSLTGWAMIDGAWEYIEFGSPIFPVNQ